MARPVNAESRTSEEEPAGRDLLLVLLGMPAVGSYENSSGTLLTLAEHWSGREWEVQSTEDPGGASSSELQGVSCTSAAACMAVGGEENSEGIPATLAEAFS